MAAALSLAGDDASSLAFWERTNKENSTPTILHEWAGALLRLGKTSEAWALPSVQPVLAYQCAERVLFLRKDFSAAAKMGEAALEQAPSATLAYDTACAFAKSADYDAALRLLQKAQALGFVDVAHAQTDSDLDALRHLPAFNEWLLNLKGKSVSMTKP
jgi:Flp pilus assembly protein TadD